jgi:hypothetical protein
VSEWKPIETAPKDGTWVLLARGGITGRIACLWDKDYAGWMNVRAGYEFRAPTHWMPLPEPPK